MTDPTQPDPVRRIAHDAASDAVPMDALDAQNPDHFEAWSAVVTDLAEDLERDLRAEVA